jgi:glycosyltransferase involved in cell wall biosynthesis
VGYSFSDLLYIAYLKVKLNYRDSQRWSTGTIQGISRPIVYYGIDNLPGQSKIASGGIIKCQDLNRHFPNTSKNSNILYLVSSALPLNGERLVRIAKRSGVKIVVNQNGVAYPAWHGPGWEKTNILLKTVIEQADYVIYQSKFCKIMSDKFLGNVSVPSSILYNPVDTGFFVPSNSQGRTHNILIAGTHNQAYRVHIALKTLAILFKEGLGLKLLIAGPLQWHRDRSHSETEMEQWCNDLDLHDSVEVVGPYSQTDAVRLFQRCDMLFHAQYNDVCPRLLVESMSSGLPVVYSSSGGSPELIGSEGGVGVDVPEDYDNEHYPDPNDMAKAIKLVYSDLEGYKRSARKRAVNLFDVKEWIDHHREIFSSILQ